MEIMDSRTILLDLDTHNALQLLIEPTFQYDNILQRNLGVYKIETGKDKMRMLHLNKPSNSLQPKQGCEHWNPTVKFNLRPYEIGVCDYELNGEQCPDEFDEGCMRNLRGTLDSPDPYNSPAINALMNAMVLLLRESLVDDVYKVAWFGRSNFRELVADGDYDLSHYSADQREKLISMIQVCDGWWAEIEARVYDTSDKGRVRWINSNDGTVAGNAINPANVEAYLRKMRLASSPILRFWNRNRPVEQLPCYLVQTGIFDALLSAYQAKDCCELQMYTLNGEPVPGVLMFEGYQVIAVPEWDMWDHETGQIDENTGYSRNQRALFTAKENLCAIANMSSLAGRPESSLVIQRSPLLKDKGKTWMFAQYGFGFGIAQPSLMTASWNTSDTFIQ
jgi:hypothetical protein